MLTFSSSHSSDRIIWQQWEAVITWQPRPTTARVQAVEKQVQNCHISLKTRLLISGNRTDKFGQEDLKFNYSKCLKSGRPKA